MSEETSPSLSPYDDGWEYPRDSPVHTHIQPGQVGVASVEEGK